LPPSAPISAAGPTAPGQDTSAGAPPAVAPRPIAPNAIATPAAPPAAVPLSSPVPTGLASLPAAVSLLLYGGMLLVRGGCGAAVFCAVRAPRRAPRHCAAV